MTTYTFRDAVIASGTMKAKIINYSQIDSGTYPDMTLDFPFQSGFQSDVEIERDAAETKVAEVRFQVYDENNIFTTKVLYDAGSPPLNARIIVLLDQGNGNEKFFIGTIDPETIKPLTKEKTVEFIAYDILKELHRISVADIGNYLGGTKTLAQINQVGGYSAGATSLVLDTLLKLDNRPVACPKNSIIRIGADTTDYLVTGCTYTGVNAATITINPALAVGAADNALIKPSPRKQSIGGTDYVKLKDVVEGILFLWGGIEANISLDRFAFRKAGDSTDYGFNDLGIFYDTFFTGTAADAFTAFESNDKAYGVLRKILSSLFLIHRGEYTPATDSTSIEALHRNGNNALERTIASKMESSPGKDWRNFISSLKVSFPVGQESNENTSGAAIKPQSKTFQCAFSQGNTTLGGFTINTYRLVLLIGGSVYEIDAGGGSTGYRVRRTDGSWQGYGMLPDVLVVALQDIYQSVKKNAVEDWATINGYNGATYALANLNLGDAYDDGGVKYHFEMIRRDPFANEMQTRRRER